MVLCPEPWVWRQRPGLGGTPGVWVGEHSIAARARASPGKRAGETGFRQKICLCKGPGALLGEDGASGTQRSGHEPGVGEKAPGAVCSIRDLGSAVGGGVPPGLDL